MVKHPQLLLLTKHFSTAYGDYLDIQAVYNLEIEVPSLILGYFAAVMFVNKVKKYV